MIECTTVISEKTQRELTKKTYIFSIISLVAGIIGIALYITLGTIINEPWTEIFLIFALPFGFGLIFIITLDTNYRTLKNNAMVNFYMFNDDNLSITTMKNNENIGTSQISYNNIIKVNENKNYLFLYLNRVSVLPIDKRTLSNDDVNKIKEIINKKSA